MIEYHEDILQNKDSRLVARRFVRHIFLLLVALFLLAAPCYLVFWLLLSGE